MAILEHERKLKERYGPDLYRAGRLGQINESEAEEVLKLRPVS